MLKCYCMFLQLDFWVFWLIMLQELLSLGDSPFWLRPLFFFFSIVTKKKLIYLDKKKTKKKKIPMGDFKRPHHKDLIHYKVLLAC